MLNKKILVYYNTILGYNFLNAYTYGNSSNDNIYIVYRNNIHFNLLKDKSDEIDFNMNLKKIKKIHKDIEKHVSKINLNKISNENCKTIFDKTYVNYRRKECPNLMKFLNN